MTDDAQILMLAIVFLSQIVVMSFVAPARLTRARRQMLERYPPEQYARLYPVSLDQIRRWQSTRRLLYASIGYTGLIVLVATLLTAASPREFSLVMTVFSMVQFAPALVVATWDRKLLRAAAKMAPPAKRSASLHAWKITDFASQTMIAFGFIGTAAALGTAAYLYAFDTHENTIVMFSAIVSSANLLLMLRVLLLPLKLTRPDPYMSQEDLFRRRQQRFRMPFRMAAWMGAYLTFMMLYSSHRISFDAAFIAAGVSLLIQLLALRLNARMARTLESTDFSVYREPSPSQSQDRPSIA